ncbi:MAG: hypothetical protein NTV01_14375 [Bacteroidia bacterium]|nr:hypothetical protein [Bacteroidia bacterium]
MKSIYPSCRLTLLVLILLSCTHAFPQQVRPAKAVSDNLMRLKKYTYFDQQGTGIQAFSFLMPTEWQFEGGMQWILDNPAMPAITAFRVYNPKGREEFEVFPNHCFFWTTNLQLLKMFPPGSKYFGNTVRRPVTAREALKKIILAEERRGFQKLTIIKDEDLPELPRALGAGKANGGYGASGAKLRISYIKEGQPMEEEFYAVVEPVTFPVQSMFGTFHNTIWFVDYIFSFKGDKGKLESHTKTFQTITASFKLNPLWYAKYSHVIEYMAQKQIQQIKSVGEFSRMLSKMSDQLSAEQLQQFEARGSVYDKVSEKFSDNTLGIDRYYDPFEGREVELPSGYNHAWCNNNGEYIVSDNPNFNPNVGSNLTWEQLKRK